MSENASPNARSPLSLQRRIRIVGVLLLVGLLVQTGTLLALERPLGFLAFALVGATATLAGILLFLWSIVR